MLLMRSRDRNAHSGHGASISRMSQFYGIRGSGCRSDGSSESKDEPATNELAELVGRALYSCADQNNHAADEDTPSTA